MLRGFFVVALLISPAVAADGTVGTVELLLSEDSLALLDDAPGHEAEALLARKLSTKRAELQSLLDRVKSNKATARERATIVPQRRPTKRELIERMELLIESVEHGDWEPPYGTLTNSVGAVGYWPEGSVRVVTSQKDYFVAYDDDLHRFEFRGFRTGTLVDGDRVRVPQPLIVSAIVQRAFGKHYVVEPIGDAFSRLVGLADGSKRSSYKPLQQFVDKARQGLKKPTKSEALKQATRQAQRRIALTEAQIGRKKAGAKHRAWMEEIIKTSRRTSKNAKRAAELLKYIPVPKE